MAIEQDIRKVQHRSACPTYHADSVTKVIVGGKRIQNGDGRFERFHDSTVTSSGSSEGLCLFLEDIRDGLEGVALLELLGQWVLCHGLPVCFAYSCKADSKRVVKLDDWGSDWRLISQVGGKWELGRGLPQPPLRQNQKIQSYLGQNGALVVTVSGLILGNTRQKVL
jgi:hypothetical protein